MRPDGGYRQAPARTTSIPLSTSTSTPNTTTTTILERRRNHG